MFRERGRGAGGVGGGSSREPEEGVGGKEVLIVVAACRHAGSREGGGQGGAPTLGEQGGRSNTDCREEQQYLGSREEGAPLISGRSTNTWGAGRCKT